MSTNSLTKDPENFKHELNSGIAAVQVAFENVTGPKPNPARATNIFQKGFDKLNRLSDAIDLSHSHDSTLLGYNETKEDVFVESHPDVIHWTKIFHDQVNKLNAFSEIEKSINKPSAQAATVVAIAWHRFSDFMPGFLCRAAAMVSTNTIRHYVIQTAFEELGMRDVNDIHPHMFWQAAELVGIRSTDKLRIAHLDQVDKVLADLEESLIQSNSDGEILGLLLGLEIPATENIETLFESMAHSTEAKEALTQSRFFTIHRQVEPEHVRLTVSNFLRFCSSQKDKERFQAGFENGIQFWKKFWDLTSKITNSVTAGGQSCA